jgi:RNA polymerase-binding transcription factor DksA
MKKKRFRAPELRAYMDRLLKMRAVISGSVSYLESERTKQAELMAFGDSGSGGGGGDHLADIGAEMGDRDRMLGLMERGEIEVGEIDAAIVRLRQGTFGTCESCTKPIPKARLRALPYARLCVHCQEMEENGGP